MRDPKRIKPLLKQIERIWKKNPDLRLMQILINVLPYTDIVGELYNYEDALIEKGLCRLEKDKKKTKT